MQKPIFFKPKNRRAHSMNIAEVREACKDRMFRKWRTLLSTYRSHLRETVLLLYLNFNGNFFNLRGN